MKPAQLLLEYQRLVDKERALREDISHLESRIAADPEVTALEETLASKREVQQEIALRLRESDRERETHRTKLRSREKELMSGRIRNPTELMQMSDEVKHMKTRFAEEEEVELRLMEEAEIADEEVRETTAQLDEARRRAALEEPALKEELASQQAELSSVETQRDDIWSQVPPAAQTAFSRVRVRPVVAKVDQNQCQVCHVTVTSSGMQVLRKGDEIVHCENCGRILVLS
jgi:predicted  nucleic acid-binding Zn-ribbon protein